MWYVPLNMMSDTADEAPQDKELEKMDQQQASTVVRSYFDDD